MRPDDPVGAFIGPALATVGDFLMILGWLELERFLIKVRGQK